MEEKRMNSTFICIDLGASNTRFCQDDSVVHYLPNNTAIIEKEEDTRLEAIDSVNLEDSLRNNLDVTIEKLSGDSEYFPVRALIGDVAGRSSHVAFRPTSNKNKGQQEINYIGVITSTAVACALNGQTGESCNELIMYLALTPTEALNNPDYMASRLKGEYKVTFNMLGLSVKIKIADVVCMAESYAALMSFFFSAAKPKEETKKYRKGKILSIDIGASTTDIAVASDGRMVERGGKTVKIGGNVVREFVNRKLNSEGYNVTVEALEDVVAQGRLALGAGYIDVSKIVSDSKQEFAKMFVAEMLDYFNSNQMPLTEFKAIVVSGGGSMRGEYVNDDGDTIVTSEAMSHYITNELCKLANGAEYIEVVPIDDSPRLANLKGLFSRATGEKAYRNKQ